MNASLSVSFRWLAFCPACMILGDVAVAGPTEFFENYCIECHDAKSKAGGLDLSALKPDFANADAFARWVKIYDRVSTGEMPPKKKERPPVDEQAAALKWL